VWSRVHCCGVRGLAMARGKRLATKNQGTRKASAVKVLGSHITSVLMALVLAVGLMPLPAFAVGTSQTQGVSGDDGGSLVGAKIAGASTAGDADLFASSNNSGKDAKDFDLASPLTVLSTFSNTQSIVLQGGTQSVARSDDSFRFVLKWGESPRDLDSHIGGYKPDGSQIHVYYAKSSASYQSDTFCTLDHDDTTSYGPETVDLATSSRFPCYYYIHNYSGSPSITTSGATVDVYKGDTYVRSFSVPTTGSGRYWNVCAVVDGRIVPRETVTSSPDLTYRTDEGRQGWSSTSTGKRIYPDYGHRYGNLDYFMTNTQSIIKNWAGSSLNLNRSFPIPGLEYSSVDGGCDAQVPQGICVTEDYVIISAYCAGDLLHQMAINPNDVNSNDEYVKNDLQVHNGQGNSDTKHDSALYIMDRASGSYLATVRLKGYKEHAGGVAFDGKNVWVAGSDDRDGGYLQEMKIPYATLKSKLTDSRSAGSDSVVIDPNEYSMIPLVGDGGMNSASFNVSTYNSSGNGNIGENYLWVGNNKKKSGQSSCYLVKYHYDENSDKLTKEKRYRIPDKGNGAVFFDYDDRSYLALNVSPGRHSESKMYIWDVTDKPNDSWLGVDTCTNIVTLPPMLEEACYYDDRIYAVFESGANVYGSFDKVTIQKKEGEFVNIKEGRADASVDEVCVMSPDTLMSMPRQYFARIKAHFKAGNTRISVACPVNVTLRDSNGNVAGVIANGVVDAGSLAEGVTAWVDGDEKSFLVPSNAGYTVDIEAYGDGEMNVTAVQYDESGGVSSTAAWEGISLQNGLMHHASLMAAGDGADVVSSRMELYAQDAPETPVQATSVNNDASGLPTVTVASEVAGDGDGSVSSLQEVSVGDYVTLVAEPDSDSTFVGWYVDDVLVGTGDDYTFKASSDVRVQARFSGIDYAFNHVAVEGAGSVGISEDSASCVYGEDVTLVAIEAPTGLFDGWYVDGRLVSRNSTLNMTEEVREGLVAKFVDTTVASVTVSVEGRDFGNAEVSESADKVGGYATLTAFQFSGGSFVGWYVGDTLVSSNLEYRFLIEGDTSLVAKFAPAVRSLDGAEVTVASKTFNGQAQTSDVSVRLADGALLSGDSYDVEWGGTRVDAGRYPVTVKGKGGYGGSASGCFTIDRAPIDGAELALVQSGFTYNGAIQKPTVATVGGKALVAGVDYAVEYSNVNSFDAGSYQVWVVGKGNYAGTSAKATYRIRSASIEGAKLALSKSSYTFNGKAKKPAVKTVDGKALVAGTDYELSYANNVNAGTATVTVVGKGNYDGTASAAFTIKPASINGAKLDLVKTKRIYNGKVCRPMVAAVGGRALEAGTDYAMGFSNPKSKNVGTYKAWVVGKGNYTGTSAKATYKITKAIINGAKIELSQTAFPYTGKVQKPKVKTVGGRAFVAGRDYTVKYSNAKSTKKGTYKVWVVGKGNCKGTSAKATYKIVLLKNPVSVAAKTPAVNVGQLSKGAQAIAAANAFSVTGNKGGKVTYKKLSGDKKVSVSKAGKVTVAKGAKEGVHAVKVKVSIAAKGSYKAFSKTVTLKVTVRPDVELAGHTLWLGQAFTTIGIRNFPEGAQVTKVTSSNKKVLVAKRSGTQPQQCTLTPVGVGESTVKVTYKVDGTTKVLSAIYRVKEYPAPFTSVKVNGEAVDVPSPENTSGYSTVIGYTGTSTKVEVVPATGWKISAMAVFATSDETGGSPQKGIEIENGASFEVPEGKDRAILIQAINSSGDSFGYLVNLYRSGGMKITPDTLWVGKAYAAQSSFYFNLELIEKIKLKGAVSSNTGVLAAKVDGLKHHQLTLTPVKPGTSTVTLTYESFDGKTYTTSALYTVKAYPNPLKSVKVNGAAVDLKANPFDCRNGAFSSAMAQLDVTPSSGWSVKSITCHSYGQEGPSSATHYAVQNGSTVDVPVDGTCQLDVLLENGSGETFSYMVSLGRP